MRLLTQYGSRELNLLYLVVDGNFTPLLGCDACLDLFGIIVKEEEHTPWGSSMLVIDKRKVKEKNTPLSKNDVRICIDPRDLNKALTRPYYPMVTVEEVANRLSGAKSINAIGCLQWILAAPGG